MLYSKNPRGKVNQTSFCTLDFDYIFHLYTCKKRPEQQQQPEHWRTTVERQRALTSENVGEPKPDRQADSQRNTANNSGPNALNSDGNRLIKLISPIEKANKLKIVSATALFIKRRVPLTCCD